MRTYISAIEHFREKATNCYKLHPCIGGARSWPTAAIAGAIRDQIVLGGGIRLRERYMSSDFRVERRSRAGFVISCEVTSY